LPELKAPTKEKGNVSLTFHNENAAERAEWKVGFRLVSRLLVMWLSSIEFPDWI